MRAYSGIVWVTLAGCNQIFGLNDPVSFVDASVDTPAPMFGDCIVEPFDTLDSNRWARLNPNMPLQITVAGELAFDGTSATPVTDGLVTSEAYDLRGGSVEVELTDPVTQSDREAAFVVRSTLVDAFWMIKQAPNSLAFGVREGGVTTFTFNAPPESDRRFWRIRDDEAALKIRLETSSDGLVWDPRVSIDDSLALGEVKVELVASASSDVVDRTAFDNFKLTALCPP